MRLVILTSIAICLGFAAAYGIATLGSLLTGVPKTFPPFTFLPVLSGAVGGPVLALIAYSIIRAVSPQPERTFFYVALFFLVLSFGLPLRLSFTKSPRFAGVTPAAQMTLVLMHTAVAAISVVTLLRKA